MTRLGMEPGVARQSPKQSRSPSQPCSTCLNGFARVSQLKLIDRMHLHALDMHSGYSHIVGLIEHDIGTSVDPSSLNLHVEFFTNRDVQFGRRLLDQEVD